MGSLKTYKKSYDERTDDEKLLSNWKKAKGLYKRKDWSASIIRVATATEIASNIYIRRFLQEQYKLPAQFVDSLLMSANDINGKFRQLIKPASKYLKTWDEVKSIQEKIDAVNSHRNEIAHSGKFKKKSDAKVVFEKAVEIVACLAPRVRSDLTMPFK